MWAQQVVQGRQGDLDYLSEGVHMCHIIDCGENIYTPHGDPLWIGCWLAMPVSWWKNGLWGFAENLLSVGSVVQLRYLLGKLRELSRKMLQF